MAETLAEDGGGDQKKAITSLMSQVESAKRIADQITSGSAAHKEVLDALSVQAEEVRNKANQAMQSAAVQVAAMEELRSRANALLKQVEEDNRKANSESGFAFNAKVNAEEHAKAIAQIRGTVEATFAGLTSTKASTDTLEQAIAASRGAAEADAKSISDTKSAVTLSAAQVTAAGDRVTAILPSIEQGSKDANAITAAKAGADASAAAIQLLQTQMSEATAKATSDATTIAKSEEDSKTLVASMTDARNRANEASARLKAYEEDIQKQGTAFVQMQAKLESLLPHATSVGLASAFHNQKARFSKPQPYWLGLFVAAIVLLLAAACYGLPATNDTWDSILRHFVNRLPIVAPLVWLAIYAGHHYNMALRMEEDYAFKEAVSTAFEGYKREMLGIPAREGSFDNPLVTLCENVLRALAERPGRIYEGRTEVVTPLTPVGTMLKDTVAEVMKAKPTTAP